MSPKQGVLKIYFAQAVFGAKLVLEDIRVHGEFCFVRKDSASDGLFWKRAETIAKRIAGISKSALALVQRFGASYCIAHCLSALDREEEALKWAMLAAKNEGHVRHSSFVFHCELLTIHADCIINSLMTCSWKDLDAFIIWGNARSACEELVEIGSVRSAGHFLEYLLRAEPITAARCPVWNLLHKYTSRYNACSTLSTLLRLLSDATKQHQAELYGRKAQAALAIVNICKEAQALLVLSRDSAAVEVWGQIWSAAAEGLLGFALLGEVCYEAGEGWSESLNQTSVSFLKTTHAKYQKLLEECAGLCSDESESTPEIERKRRIVDSVRQELKATLQLLLSSDLVHHPEVPNSELQSEFSITLRSIQAVLQRCQQADVDYSRHLAFYAQQAQRVDRRTSPAHAHLADCWQAAAQCVVQAQDSVAEEWARLEQRESQLSQASVWVKLMADATQYAQLAESLLAQAVEYQQQSTFAARKGEAQAAHAWALAVEFTLGAADTQHRIIAEGAYDHRLRSQQVVRAQETGAQQLADLAHWLTRKANKAEAQSAMVAVEVSAVLQLKEQELRHREAAVRWANTALATYSRHDNVLYFVCELLDRFATCVMEHLYRCDSFKPPHGEINMEHVLEGAQLAVRCSNLCIHALIRDSEINRAFTQQINSVGHHLRMYLGFAQSRGNADKSSAVQNARLIRLELRRAEALHMNETWRCFLLKPAIELLEPLLNTYSPGDHSPWLELHSALAARLESLAEESELGPAELVVNAANAAASEPLDRIVQAYAAGSEYARLAAIAPRDSVSADCYRRAAAQMNLHALYLRFQEDLRFDGECEKKFSATEVAAAALSAARAAEYLRAACLAQESGRADAAALWIKAAACCERREEPVASVPRKVIARGGTSAVQLAGKAGKYFANAARALDMGKTNASAAWKSCAESMRILVEIYGYSFGVTLFAVHSSVYTEQKLRTVEKQAKEADAMDKSMAAVTSVTVATQPTPPHSARRSAPAARPTSSSSQTKADSVHTSTGNSSILPRVSRAGAVASASASASVRLGSSGASGATVTARQPMKGGKPDTLAARR